MESVLLNTNLLKSQMLLHGVTVKAFADVQGWSSATAYRKINGKVAFTAPEIQSCVELLSLSSDVASQIFFCELIVLNDRMDDATNYSDAICGAKECVMIERLLHNADTFYKNQKNLRVFEAWRKNKEEKTYGTNHSNA